MGLADLHGTPFEQVLVVSLSSLSEMEATFTQRTQALLEESKLLEMQFSVDLLSLSVQSRGNTFDSVNALGGNVLFVS